LLSVADYAGAAHAYTAALAVFPGGVASSTGIPARLNRLVAWLGACAFEEVASDGVALLRDPTPELLSKEQRRKVCLRTAASLSQLGRYSAAADILQAAAPSKETVASVTPSPSSDAEGWEAAWASMAAALRDLSDADAIKAQAAAAAVASDLAAARDFLDRAVAIAPDHIRAVLNSCSVALATANSASAGRYVDAAAALLESVPEQHKVDGAGVCWLLRGLPPRGSPQFVVLQGELEVRRQALIAMAQSAS
jgi:tetratricopeptide (TPR) repeat protein